jgi:predicted aspartyl protease
VRFLLTLVTVSVVFELCPAQATVPLTWDSTGHVVIDARVNGKGPYPFILDTGADESGVYDWFARSLGLPSGPARELSGATGSEPSTVAKLSTLSVDGHAIRQVEADTFPDRVDGAKLAGVAGVDLMRGRLAVIDFGCSTFALLPLQATNAKITGAGATKIKAGTILDGQQLTFPVTVNGVTSTAVLDSGSRYTFINSQFAAALKVDPASASFKDAPPTRGATMTKVVTRVGPIGEVKFAGISIPNAEARVVDLPYFQTAGLADKPAMNLGVDFLARTRLTLDFSSRQFWLARSSCSVPHRQ